MRETNHRPKHFRKDLTDQQRTDMRVGVEVTLPITLYIYCRRTEMAVTLVVPSNYTKLGKNSFIHASIHQSVYWKWNFPMRPNVRRSVGWLVVPLVCHNFLQEGREIGALVIYVINASTRYPIFQLLTNLYRDDLRISSSLQS